MGKNKQFTLTLVILLGLALFLLTLFTFVFKNESKITISESKPVLSITFSMLFTKKEIIPYSNEVKEGLIGKIRDIEVDQDENIFILDITDHNIKKFNSQGMHLLTIGRKGQGPGELSLIPPYTNLEVWEDKLYVIDPGNMEIDIFNKNNGIFLNSFPIDFEKVMDFFVLNDEIFLLSYRISDRKTIHKYDSVGDHILSFGYTGLNESEKQRIRVYSYYCYGIIDYDREGRIYYSPAFLLINNVLSEKGNPIIIFSRKNSFFRSPDLNNRYYDQKLPFIENMKVVSNKFIFNVIKVRENKNRKILDIYNKTGNLIISDIIFPDDLYDLRTCEIDNNGNLYYFIYPKESFDPIILKFVFNPEILNLLISH